MFNIEQLKINRKSARGGESGKSAIKLLRMLMIERDIKRTDLARRIGRPVKYLSEMLSRNAVSWPVGLAINKVFGETIFRKPVRNPRLKSNQHGPAT